MGNFRTLAIIALACIGFTFLLKRVKTRPPTGGH